MRESLSHRPARVCAAGRIAAAFVASLGLLAGASAWAADEPAVTDANVDNAIQRAVTWIKSQRNAEGNWDAQGGQGSRDWAGDSALAILSLLYAGENPLEGDLNRSLAWLAGQTLNGTYVYGTRAHALALLPQKMHRSRLEGDLKWLLDAIWPRGSKNPGGYDYTPAPKETLSGRWDNSVTQFGVLGVWMAADAGLPVPETYWEIVAEHWLTWQNQDGGWSYQEKQDSTGSMTAAGLASLFVVLDQRYADRPKDAGLVLGAIERGLDWFGRQYRADENPNMGTNWLLYYLYGVERVGRASGFKYFRDKDWFHEGAGALLASQKPDGHWEGAGGNMNDLRNTAFGLMFLCHGRAPLLFNKLQHGEDWKNKPRDVAGLTRYAGHAYERLMNWQIVRLSGPLDDLLEAPVVYLRGESAWEFDDVAVQKIRECCQRGGLVFAVVGNNSEPFRRSFETLAQKTFPEYPLKPLPDDHPLFNGEVQFEVKDPPLTLQVHNGVRTLLLLSTRDLGATWNKYAAKGKQEDDFHLGCNVYQYAVDKTTVRSRLQTVDIPLRPASVTRTIKVARIKYNGHWDPEPYGWTRLGHYLNNDAATRILVTSAVTFDSETLKDFKVAHITGTSAFELNAEEVKGLQHFLTGGGTLLADATGSSREFTKSLEGYVREALKTEPRGLPPDSFVLTGTGLPDGTDLAGTGYRRSSRSAGGRAEKYPPLKAFGSQRRFAVVYSPLDLSAGLLGTQLYGLQGYDPESTLKIMRNLVLYAGLSSAEKARLHRGE